MSCVASKRVSYSVRAAMRPRGTHRLTLVAFAPLMVLAACSGGNDGGGVVVPAPTPTPTPAPANSAPVITSAATATMVENRTAAYQATATDADGDTVTFAIAGGADAALFVITPGGALAFAAAPAVAQPRDSNGDNVYEVRLSASDGTASTTRDVRITVLPAGTGLRVVRVGTGFAQPTYVGAVPIRRMCSSRRRAAACGCSRPPRAPRRGC